MAAISSTVSRLTPSESTDRCMIQLTMNASVKRPPISDAVMTGAQRNTSRMGDLSELEVTLALMRAGHRVLRPVSAASRYDLAIDNTDGTLTRIQCKSGVLRDGRIVFRVYSVSGHQSAGKPYQGQVDAFGVYCDATKGAYLVPLAAIPKHRVMVCLRVSPSKNGQRQGIRMADDFLLGGEARGATSPGLRSGREGSTR